MGDELARDAEALRRAASTLQSLSEAPETLLRLRDAVLGGDRETVRSLLAEYPNPDGDPRDCLVATAMVPMYVPAGPDVCVWNVGPNAGQVFVEPATVDIVNGPSIPWPFWLTEMLKQLGVIECRQLTVRDWTDKAQLVCGGPEFLAAGAGT